MTQLAESVTVLIPAYNEETYIGHVLEPLTELDEVSQILVVDDGSTDSTCAVVKDFCRRDPRIQLHALDQNRGKAGAMIAGIERSQNDLMVFLDADLIHLRAQNVRDLWEPVGRHECAMTLGIFSGGRRQTDWSHRLTPFLSGQRCLRWHLFRGTPRLDDSRWGIETALSLYAWHQGYPVREVRWQGVTHAMRPEKMSRLRGYLSHVSMWLDITRYIGTNLISRQIQVWKGSHRQRWQKSARSIAQREI